MLKKLISLLGVGIFLMSSIVQASVFQIEEYSNLERYLKPEQKQIFEKIIGENLDKIEDNIAILENLKLNGEDNIDSILLLEREIQSLKLANEKEIAILKKDFVRNPQRYNIETVFEFAYNK